MYIALQAALTAQSQTTYPSANKLGDQLKLLPN
jgi:hypothetical protein